MTCKFVPLMNCKPMQIVLTSKSKNIIINRKTLHCQMQSSTNRAFLFIILPQIKTIARTKRQPQQDPEVISNALKQSKGLRWWLFEISVRQCNTMQCWCVASYPGYLNPAIMSTWNLYCHPYCTESDVLLFHFPLTNVVIVSLNALNANVNVNICSPQFTVSEALLQWVQLNEDKDREKIKLAAARASKTNKTYI